MDIKKFLSERMSIGDVMLLSKACECDDDNTLVGELFAFAADSDIRVRYNALWVFTHLSANRRQWLMPKRNAIIDMLLTSSHEGLQRLLLTLLESMPPTEDIRVDYLDFCMSKINSAAPYAIRALSLKQAFAQCRHNADLLNELTCEMELMGKGELSPGLRSARRIVMAKIAKIK